MRLQLHRGQQIVWADPSRIKLLVCGRRFGKSSYGVQKLLYKTLTYEGSQSSLMPTLCIGAMPTGEQAVSVLWEPLMRLVEHPSIAPAVADINKSRREIKFHGNKPIIRIRGTNDQDGDRLRGGKIYYFLGDEAQDFNATVLDNVVLPAMADTPGSSMDLTSTPKGRQNFIYKFYQRMQGDPDFRFFSLPTFANPLVSKSEILRLKRTLPRRLYEQEVLASFVNFPGKIYWELDELNLCDDIPAHLDYVELGVDFGSNNPAIVAIGTYGENKYLLEGWYPDRGVPVTQDEIDKVLLWLCHKWNPIATYCDPSRPSDILHIRQLPHRGLKAALEGYNPISEGITQVHSLVFQKRLLFCRDTSHVTRTSPEYRSPEYIFDEMNSYHFTTDRKTGLVIEKVEEGQQDHLCLAGSTSITTDKGLVPLSQVRSGTKVLTRAGYKRVLVAAMTSPSADTFTVTFSNGATLTGTKDHPIWTVNGWTRLGDLGYGTEVLTQDASVTIVKVVPSAAVPVYNLEVEGQHEYFANGVLSHNCDALRYCIARKKGQGFADFL